jgi:RNase H-fold protein (predicted Holliday junction resolvase)
MLLTADDLLPDEQVLLTKPANAVLALDEYGLSEFAFGQFLPLVGMRGKEAIGGKLHLTNYRLVFKSHNWNRICGRFSIMLPTIRSVKDDSFFIFKKMRVATQTQKLEYVVWGIPQLMQAIREQQAKLAPETLERLKRHMVTEYAKCGDGLQTVATFEALNMAILAGRKLTDITDMVTNPLQLSNVLNFIEMVTASREEPTNDNE